MGTRPFLTWGELTETIRAAEQGGAAILVAPETDTVKEVHDGVVVRTIPRAQLRRALTPAVLSLFTLASRLRAG